MNDAETEPPPESSYEALRMRAEGLERQLREAELHAATQLRQTELKGEAMRAGIIDLDGLRLIDPAALSGSQDGTFDAPGIVSKLRRDKPWLFGAGSSSSAVAPPTAVATKRRLATEMSVEEWRSARAELLRRR